MAKAATKKSGSRAMDVAMADFLVQNANVSGPKESGGIPKLGGYGALADRVASAYKASKDAEALFRLAEGELLEVTGPEYERRSVGGEHTKSLDVPGLETSGVQVTYSDKFSALPIEQESGLKAELGAGYDALFEQKRMLTLKEECTDAQSIKLLREKLGDELFLRVFDIRVTVVAKDGMDRKQWEIPEAVRTLCGLKQAKASVKVRK